MDFKAAVTDQIALLNQGKPLEAFDRYFADDGVMFDNDEVFATGKAECRAKQEALIAKAATIEGNITYTALDDDDEICVFRNQSGFVDEAGDRTDIDGIHWQRWADGKIVEDRYYRGAAMEEKIAQGILEDGEPTPASAIESLPPHEKAQATRFRGPVLDALAALRKGEHVEITDEANELVADELVLAALEAHTPKHALKKLRLALIHSDNVEEVYADDHTLEDAFRKALGG